jgi:sporulation protein YlmC with PRC-barrel domain
MKRTALTVLAVAVALGVVAPGALAEDKDRRASMTYAFERGQVDSRHLIGMRVEFPDGKRAGTVDHLIFDKDRKLSHAVIAKGGFAGIGRKEVVVPWSQLRMRRDDGGKNVAMVDRATLDNAPRYHGTIGRPGQARRRRRRRTAIRDGVPNRLDRAPSNSNRQ